MSTYRWLSWGKTHQRWTKSTCCLCKTQVYLTKQLYQISQRSSSIFYNCKFCIYIPCFVWYNRGIKMKLQRWLLQNGNTKQVQRVAKRVTNIAKTQHVSPKNAKVGLQQNNAKRKTSLCNFTKMQRQWALATHHYSPTNRTLMPTSFLSKKV